MNGTSNEALPGIAVYNPSLLRKEDLIAQFVARRPLLDRLVAELRRGGNDGAQHQLIVGPRGSGKTTLLRRLQFAIEEDPELNARWIPLSFPEEQYNVSRLSDLWANCLDALSDLLERRGREAEAGMLDRQIESLPAEEKRRAKAALDLLVGWAKQEDRGFVLLFDNSDLIFDRLKKEHWAIREVLSADNHLLFIGATSAPIEATYDHKGAFYDFFNILNVGRLTDQETRDVLRNLAERRGTKHVLDILDHDPGRIRSLNLLTGGNLRTIVVLYQVLAQGTDDSIRHDLEQLLDHYTPLYKHRFEALSTQSQHVVDALALHWDPTTAADLADKLRVKTNAVSAVLDRLVNDGVIEKAPAPPGEKTFFQITERFFNIWYLMRASRRVRGKLLWLVRFLNMFYGAPGLQRRARHLLQDAPAREHNRSHRAELALAYAEAVGEPDLRRALINEGVRSLMSRNAESRRSMKVMFDLEGEDTALKPVVERFQTLRELSEQIECAKGSLPNDFWDQLIATPSLRLEEKKKKADEIARLGLDECKPLIEEFAEEAKDLAEKFGADACRELFDAIRNGDMADGADVEGADAAAIKWNDASLKVIARLSKFDRAKEQSLLEQAESMLDEVSSPEIWLSCAEKIAETDGGKEKLQQIHDRVLKFEGLNARCWHRIGRLLKFHLEQYQESERAYLKSIELYPEVAAPWDGYGDLLANHLQRFEEAEAAFRKAIDLNPRDEDTWGRLGDLLSDHLKLYEEAEEAYRKAIELAPSEGAYRNDLGNLLADHLKRYEEAEEAYRKAIELDPKEAVCWNNLGILFHYHLKGRFEEAEAAYRQAIELAPSVADFWDNLGDLLADHLKRYEESEAAYRKAINLDQADAGPWIGLGNLLQDHLKRYEESESVYRKAIELDPSDALPWNNLGNLLKIHPNRSEDSELAYQRAIELDAKFASPWNGIGNLLQSRMERYEDSELAYRKAIELDPKSALPWNNLGALLQSHLKRYEESELAYRKAIELDPNYVGSWYNFGNLLQDHLRRYEDSESAYRKAIELDLNYAWPWRRLGHLFHYLMKSRLDEAEEAYCKAIELDPTYAETWHDFGSLLSDKLNRPEEGIAAYRKAVELEEGNAEYLNVLAWQLYLRNRDMEEAEQHSRRSVELEPGEVNYAHTFASILVRRGKWSDALLPARQFIQKGDDEFHERYWAEIIAFIRDAVATGHTEEAVALLDETEFGERWRPLREALRAIAEDDASYLLRVAPEVRQPAEEIVAMLLPEGVRLGTVPKPTRKARSRRKAS